MSGLNKKGCTRGRFLLPDAVVVVAATFMINLIYGGILYGASGLLLQAFLDALQEGKSRTALMFSLQNGVMLCCGILSSPMIDRFGTRPTSFIGSFLASVGLLTASLSTSAIHMDITFGFITGVGFGYLMLPSAVCVQQHTRRRRALAAGIGIMGTGVGTFVMPIFIQWSLNTYSWRGTILLLSGCLLQTVPCSLLLFPPEKKHSKPAPTKEEETLANGIKPKEEYLEIRKRDTSDTPPLGCGGRWKRCDHVIRDSLRAASQSTPNLKDPVCALCMLGIFCLFIAYNIPTLYVALLVAKAGHSLTTAVKVIAISGFANIAVRVPVSVVACVSDHLPFYICTASILLFGAASIALIFSQSVIMLTAMMSLVGIAFGIISSLVYTVVRDLVGIHRFHWVTGIGFASAGIGSIAALQLIAFIWEATDSLAWPYAIAAGLTGIATLSFSAAKIMLSRQTRKHTVMVKEIRPL